MADSGIYEIVNLVNGKRYVGSAVWIVRRWCQHRHRLRAGTHYSRHLQRAWSLYGESKFVFRVLEIVAEEALLEEREQHYIDSLRPEYNLRRKVAGSNLGVKWGAETIARMSLANREIWQRPGHREKMSAAQRGKKRSPEAIAKAAATQRERMTQEYRVKKGAQAKAQWSDPSYRAKVLAALNSPEQRQRNSEAAKARWADPEWRAAMCAKIKGRKAHNKGKPQSEEQKAKQSAAMRRKWEDAEYRALHRERTRLAMAEPDVREKCRRGNLGRVHSLEERAKRAAGIRAAWARKKAVNSA